ncbi:uncharacterized protein KY384_002042 [Bacidia gigantensis]|uniref:uncharacterized protein n=1 Tax=Bacidia gigantensis TaxID=2732470 RepID=UPI001D036C05|nr:uncharacterized protein KY384_002042 [Bacidia gigantensis]KAG8533259.1 hypothetical protein KY384_002042 [Bacidia gigantensis]
MEDESFIEASEIAVLIPQATEVDIKELICSQDKKVLNGHPLRVIAPRSLLYFGRPRLRLKTPMILFNASAVLHPHKQQVKDALRDPYLSSGVPTSQNLFEPLRMKEVTKGMAPSLSASRLHRVQQRGEDSLTQPKPMRVNNPEPFPALPAISSRIRYHKANIQPGQAALVASLDMEIAPFSKDDIEIASVEMHIVGGAALDMGQGHTPKLPVKCRPKDNLVFLYRLACEDVMTDASTSALRLIDITVNGVVLASEQSKPLIQMHWKTSVDFSSALNPAFGAPGQSLQRKNRPSSLTIQSSTTGSSTDSPLISEPSLSSLSELGITITFTAPPEIYVQESFVWDVLVLNRSARARHFLMTAVTKSDKGGTRKDLVKAPPSFVSKLQVKDVAESVVDESAVFGDQRVAMGNTPGLVSLNPTIDIGEKGADGSRWNEKIFGDSHWAASFRSLVRWQGSNTQQFDGITLEQNAPLAMEVSPDGKNLFAVCLNHTLRIWNLNKGLVFDKDLLCQRREQHDVPRMMLDPANTNLLQIFTMIGSLKGHGYYLLTFSPYDYGQFKFWGIRDPDAGDRGVQDLFPEAVLKAPDPDPNPASKAIWNVADFRISVEENDRQVSLWVLLRSGRQHRLYNLRCILENIVTEWTSQWTSTSLYEGNDTWLPQTAPPDDVQSQHKWLELILRPGMYPEILIENALIIYCARHDLTQHHPKDVISRRLSSAVESRVKSRVDALDTQNTGTVTHQEWNLLWQDICDLNYSRYALASLAFDDYRHMPWIVFADSCSAIRTCTELESTTSNTTTALSLPHPDMVMRSVETDTDDEHKLPSELAVVTEAASSFRSRFSSRLEGKFRRALAKQLWSETSLNSRDQLEQFHDECDFSGEVEDGVFDDLTNEKFEPIGGLENLDKEAFFAIMRSFSHQMPDARSDLAFTKFGLGTIINGAREMVAQRERLLGNLLALTVFTEVEVDRNDTPMEHFDGPQIFERLLPFLKQYQVMHWLVSHNIHESFTSCRKGDSKTLSSTSQIDWNPTVLESLFAVHLQPQASDPHDSRQALTHSIQDLLQWVIGGNNEVSWENVLVHIQSFLLFHRNIDLASSFSYFQPSTPAAKYLRGRLALLQGHIDEASREFESSAEGSSNSRELNHESSNHLLSEAEAAHFGQGLTRFYLHITNLFNGADPPNPSQATYFAELALEHAPPFAKSKELHAKLLSSLFYASIETRNFTTAHSALTRHPLSENLLPTLLDKILDTKNTSHLLEFNWSPKFQRQIDALLCERVPKDKPKDIRKILAAWRLHSGDFQGAARALLPPLYELQAQARRSEAEEKKLENDYLTVINLLACAGSGKEWALVGGDEDSVKKKTEDQQKGKPDFQKEKKTAREKRRLVTLDDLRAQYQAELDRRSIIERGTYAFARTSEDGDLMDLQ